MQGRATFLVVLGGVLVASVSVVSTLPASAGEEAQSFIPQLLNSSTIPADGDLNPHGVTFVPETFPSGGSILEGDVLVSNFNNNNNIQGTGTTIIRFRPTGPVAPAPTSPSSGNAVTFFASTLPGLTSALGVFREGFVMVGNVPTSDGTFGGIKPGALQLIDRYGRLVQTLTDPVFLAAPWGLAIDDEGPSAHVFVSNVTKGTVSRLDVTISGSGLNVVRQTIIATGYTVQPNIGALVLGPGGLTFDRTTDTLYVASAADNCLYAVYNARERTTAVSRGVMPFSDPHLRGPLALKLAPNGHLLAANGDAVNADPLQPSEILEFTKTGVFVRDYNVDAAEGAAFGLDAVRESAGRVNYAAVDDVTDSVSVYRLPIID